MTEQNKNIFDIGKVENKNIVTEMQESYLDYAMSVIVARALPDVRDGLKPVHRRILYAMWQLGLKSNSKYRKSAMVVGEVLGKYHPHGDVAVYDSMVRMAQDFSLRYTLINGQGNFGSVDGDNAAAMRYTESKLQALAEELLFDLDKETVRFVDNYDSSTTEPSVLPAKIPNLLINGGMGIAVGMATNIPPHNLGETIDATLCLIDNPEATIEDLMCFIKGPDLPTGGIIFDKAEIQNTYTTGHGSIITRGVAEIVEEKNGHQIIISEFPYQVNKSEVIINIANLVRDKQIEGIKDIRDESNKDGIRVVIELKRDSFPNKILNQLYKFTALQNTIHVNLLALVDGIQPKVLSLKSILEEYIKHRQTVVRARTQFELKEAQARVHILLGLKIALDNIDAIIKLIKSSADRNDARENLMKKYKLSEIQSNAILDMRFGQLAKLQRFEIENELKEKQLLIKHLQEILSSPKKLMGIIKAELNHIKEKYADERRTKIVPTKLTDFNQEDIIPDEPTVVVITKDGYIKRLSPDIFKAQTRGGKGVIGIETKAEDVVDQFLSATTHNDLLCFTTRGRVFKIKVYEVSLTSRTAKGQALVNFLNLQENEKVSVTLPLTKTHKSDAQYLVMITKRGVIKKVAIKFFENVRKSGLTAIKLKPDDCLEWVKPSSGKDQIMLVTTLGKSIRFKESNVREMGRVAGGVRGIRLAPKDEIVSMDIVSDAVKQKKELLVITTLGFGKRTDLNQYRIQARGGSGIKTAKITPKIGKIIKAFVVDSELSESLDLIIISQNGQVIRLHYKEVNKLGRTTQGVRVMRFKQNDDLVASIALV